MQRRTLIRLAATSGTALAASLATGGAARARERTRLVVAADGSGDVTTVQAAVDAVPPGTGTRFTIDIRPGVYAGQVIVPADKPNILLRGRGADPGRVVITDDRASGTPRPDGGTWGTSGSASVTVDAADFTATNLTFANSFDEAAHPEITARQAVALLSRADRLVFDNVRFLGNQDTLYLNSPPRPYRPGSTCTAATSRATSTSSSAAARPSSTAAGSTRSPAARRRTTATSPRRARA